MFAFFGIGILELIVLAILALFVFGVPLGVVLILTTRRSAQSDEVAQLRAEIQRLNDEIERLKKGSA